MTAVVWDALGTLLSVEPVRRACARAGAPEGAFDAWFERILHTGAALTLLGEFAPLGQIAESTLPTALAQLGLDPAGRGPLEALRQELVPEGDAAAALAVLEAAGVESFVLTNGGESSTREALRRGGIEERIRDVVSVEEVRRFKPDRAPYAEAERRVGSEPWLIAAHAWDVLAARTYGWNAVWVDRLERRWPLPQDEPGHRAADLVQAAKIVRDAQ